MSQPEQVALEPVADDGVGASVVGLVLWAVAGVVCFVQRDSLAERGAQWWIWTCGAGLLIGVGLLLFTRRRARAYGEHRASQQAHGTDGTGREPGSQ
jgi:ABC-type nickel/cobalt efflux system permease component RcnA